MARCCITTWLAHLLLLACQLLAVSASKTAFLSSADAPSSRNGQHSTAVNQIVVIREEQLEGERRHGMTPSLIAPAAAAGASSSAVAAAASRSFRSSKRRHWWLYSGTCVRRSGSAGLRALSFLSPALAPAAGGAVTGVAPPAREPGRSGFAPPPLGESSRCRPLARSRPYRFSISKPSKNTSPSARTGDPTGPSPPATTDTGATSEIGCGGGGGGGGMRSTFTWLESVNSTMDEAKTLIVNQQESGGGGVFAVAAREQLRGRGTKGRAWIGLPGNVFLTVAIPLDKVPVPLSLIPLRVGTLIAPEIERRLRHREPSPSPSTDQPSSEPGIGSAQPRVSLKWPNDVLLGGAKVAGVLIEAELPFLLVGIGVNVRHKPDVPQQGPDRGRPAACLADFGADSTDEAARELSAALTERLCSWASGEDSAQAALSDWSRWVDWTLPLEIRDEGRAVTPVGVAPDGRLRVVDPAIGKEELLTTEYLL